MKGKKEKKMKQTENVDSPGGCVVSTDISLMVNRGDARATTQNCVSNGNFSISNRHVLNYKLMDRIECN